ncbi:uncharacterized protein LAESUDRAFT_711730 [Laetiporus sulphureus 93-53]|uniref:GATA-type domain-containing protein n=1 Tax=Laetiporus sulphureus 93-53 TaxID=1314785 RepID=A0A165G4V8_9APHY|nr:uncharacterized protein LAESUDRAFT_711730 [Laetiporus sulphureus 93-53]KZT09832.1 hypothetical protein LAESUDRAFT_711730 [Laetiporus sulphureus 93-53]
MPPYFPLDRQPLTAPIFTALAQPAHRSPTPVSSYTSLDHALGPAGARESNHPLHEPPPPAGHLPPNHMASDGRYVYSAPQEVAASPYGYAPYPAPPYDPAHYAQSMPRQPIRSASTQAHSPHPPPQPYSASQQSYPPQPPYGPPPYAVAPHPTGPWSHEAWAHYPHPYPAPHPPQPPDQNPSYPPNGARADAPPVDHRAYQAGPSRPEPHRTDERPSRPVEAAPQSKVRKTKENEPPAPAPPRSPPLGLDLTKLMEQYRVVLDSSATLLNDNSSRTSIPLEAAEAMMQAARFGFQALESASKRVTQADISRSPSERTPEEADSAAPKPRPQPSEAQPNPEGQTCLGCHATSTPEWRRGPMGPRTLCNACGLVYAKLIKKRNRDPARARSSYLGGNSGSQGGNDDSAPASSGEGGSDDEGSLVSQDRRSEGGFHGGRN